MNARGYRVAAIRSALAFVVLLLAAEALAFLAVGEGSDVSLLDTIKIGGLTFFSFHHVGIGVDLPQFDLGGLAPGGVPGGATPLEFGFTARVAIAMTLATGIALWLWYRAGRSAAEAGGGSVRDRLLLGASVALPYAVLSLVLSFLVSFSIEAPTGPGVPFQPGTSVDVAASPVAAFFWPLVLGAIAGTLGGLASARAQLDESGRAGWTLAVLGGAARMLKAAAVVAGIGLLVLAAANWSVFIEYWRGVSEAGVRGGILLVLLTVLLTPNFMIVLAYLGMMSGVVVGDYLGTSSVTLLTLLKFPAEGDLPPGLDPGGGLGPALDPTAFPFPFQTQAAPLEWWISVLIPLAAVLWGGRWVARRVATTRGEGAFLGALAGLAFAFILLGFAILAGIGFRVDLSFLLQARNMGRLGPSLLGGTLLALLWGVFGGALGGALGGRRPSPSPTSGLDLDPAPPPLPPPG